MSWKTLNFLKSVKLEDWYLNGNIIPTSLLKKKGIVLIGIEKDNNGNDRNKVIDYVTTLGNFSNPLSYSNDTSNIPGKESDNIEIRILVWISCSFRKTGTFQSSSTPVCSVSTGSEV